MIVGDVTELRIVNVLDRGVPNKECVAIQVHRTVNMGKYGIMVGSSVNQRMAVPYFDHLFWFGDGIVNSGDWLFVFTGSGNPQKTPATNERNTLYSVYWGKPTTVFADTSVVPVLFRVDAVDVPLPPGNVPQLGGPNT